MRTICYVILNYKTYEEAAACAESILSTQTWKNMHIVIVDNGSGNGSEEWLVEHFIDEKRVRVIASGENLGFARGNNLGIRYAREHYDPDLIVAANSDILFEQPDFCERLFEIYDRKPYAILGADVVDATRTQHFNPVAEKRSYTLNYMRKQIVSSWIRAMSYRMSRMLLGKKNGGDLSRSTGATREVDGEAVAADSRVSEEREGVLLHGCCLVFSRDFFKVYDGFWEGTFLYAEEEILYYLAAKSGLRMLYSPEVICIHKEAVTTRKLYGDVCDAKIFYYTQITKSYRAFLGLMKKYEK